MKGSKDKANMIPSNRSRTNNPRKLDFTFHHGNMETCQYGIACRKRYDISGG